MSSSKLHSKWLLIAALAAIIATLGDCIFMLLFFLDLKKMDPQTVQTLLWSAGILGVIAIPFYAIGYRAIASIIFTPKSITSRFFLSGVTFVSILAAGIHGLTAVNMHKQIKDSNLVLGPLESMLTWGTLFLGLWAVAVIGIIITSVIYFWQVTKGRTKLQRKMAYANPLFITLFISLFGIISPLLGEYLSPTAPNVAHIVFFVLIWKNVD